MNLGVFYLSLSVADLKASRTFYEKMGFEVIDGAESWPDMRLPAGQDWAILRNGETKIGLFQGMFPQNMFTFHASDVRAIRDELKRSSIELVSGGDETDNGPAHLIFKDPDGNMIMIDQG